ncbi:MAG TPA: carbohydrate ABC transporter permease [Candidatus Dormibacteraeota bacterium]|nr:carbohydrate ABC transporter permease [Candidatus Dormibacteraeota bacterium]
MIARRIGWALFLGMMVAFAMLPLYWMLVVSLKTGKSQLVSGNPWWPENFTVDHYRGLLTDPSFGRLILNTAVVTGMTIVISLVASILAGFALVYYRLKRSRGIAFGLFASYLLPPGLLFLPIALMLTHLRLTDSVLAMIITYPSLVIPFGTWVLWMFFNRLPTDVLDLARAEGARPMQILRYVLLPLSVPALAAVALFAVAVVFNDYLYAFTLVNDPNSRTLMADVGSNLVDIDDPGPTFAEIMLGMAPMALLCAFFADTFSRGLATGVVE